MPPKLPYRDPGTPDARGSARYLWWLVKKQRWRVALGVTWGTLWMLLLMVPPYLISRAIDDGLRARDLGALFGWVGAILLAGTTNAFVGLMRHRTMTFIRLDAAFRTVQVVVRHAVRLGAVLPRRVTTGEVVTVGAADLDRIARTMTVTGPGVGGVIAYAAVAVAVVHDFPCSRSSCCSVSPCSSAA